MKCVLLALGCSGQALFIKDNAKSFKWLKGTKIQLKWPKQPGNEKTFCTELLNINKQQISH